ncbi:hypothetical protein CORC01_13684 [Colletotrichum orchidophilum]|uniref:Asl1-like glycosyl hydrolase catalytic domain-containing protein n=1 Tax=Colletotrichum orchidophilum TaxID=1209926 RepID=A0A1G4APK8_9PEZI|nr:uncharacterized protein CORC01_13684 [Colletotrichum orchidophilum]OHE91003.1 hypothetical protein CORC01_13684 [Colletotrichum orchidophilum]
MYTKKALSVVASLALAEQALGFNAHRHIHQDKRHLKIDVVTQWVTITVTDGESFPSATPTPTPTPIPSPQPAVPEAQYTPTTTSTSIIVVPTPNPTPTPVYAAPSTTLVKSVAPSSSSQAPVAEALPNAAAAVASAPAIPPAKPTTSAAAAVNPPSTGGKRGVAYTDASKVSPFFTGAFPKFSWAYNWNSIASGITVSGVNFVPMLWGPIDSHTASWAHNADASIKNGSTCLLSFNEPDMPSQSNVDAVSAAAAHVKYMNPYSSLAKIGAPAVTNSNNAGQGVDWLRAWVDACKTAGCDFDFCPTHWYSAASAAESLFSHLDAIHEACEGKPVWLTEFAPFGSDDEISSFVSTNLPKLDSLSYLERYSYFMASDGILNSGSGLSALGQVYAAAA